MEVVTRADMRQRLGNVNQLRELLFGEKIAEFETGLEEHKQRIEKLESDSQKLKNTIEKCFQELESKLTSQINTLTKSTEQKIQYINRNNQDEHQKIEKELKTISKYSYSSVEFLQTGINDQNNSLRLELNQAKSLIDRDLQFLKRQIFDKLESRLSELSSAKLSSNDLSEFLFELCLKLKDPSAIAKLADNTDNVQLLEG